MGLRSITVKNVIRLAVDDYDFYLDEQGVDDDLEQAMFEFKAKVDPLESELFNTIYLVLEHIDEHLKYLIEISITRKHTIGEYPIKINVNGVLKDFKYLDEDSGKERLKAKIEEIFNNQDKYNTFINEKKKIFNNFLDELAQAIKKFIRVDDFIVQSNTQVIRLKESIKSPSQIRHGRYSEPVHYGYYGINNYFFYTTMWSGLMYHNNIYCSNCMIVDGLGEPIMNVGETGFYAGETNTLNAEAPFEPPAGGDIEYFGNNEFENELNDSNLISSSDDTAGADGGAEDSSWLDTAAEGDSGACSSCSSCGGCT